MATSSESPAGIESRLIEIPAAQDAGTQVPITTIHGELPGPTLALVAGNHGYEYPPILALQRVVPLIDVATLSGTVILVHVANMPSFLGRTVYFSPVDGKNLNRAYPGRPDGTVCERIAHAVTTEVIEKADYLLDLHCGDANEWLRPYVYQTVTGQTAIDSAMAGLALAFGIDHILVDRGRPTDPAKSIYCSTTAITRGKPAITVESGYLGTSDPECVEQILTGIFGVMFHLGMIPDGPKPLASPVYLDPSQVIFSPATGILYAAVEPGQTVSRGDVLARITDFFGNPVAEVTSPLDGVVLYIVTTPPITQGQPIGCVGTATQTSAI